MRTCRRFTVLAQFTMEVPHPEWQIGLTAIVDHAIAWTGAA
jgi:hypothetical protein